jgi:hypothetical protein
MADQFLQVEGDAAIEQMVRDDMEDESDPVPERDPLAVRRELPRLPGIKRGIA